MELAQLYYFMKVAELEHVTKAANELNLAQPALTKSIHLLEKELDIKLFENVGRNIKLTTWGRWFYEKIKEPLKNLNSLPEEIKKLKEINHISICNFSSTIFLTDAIIEFQKKYKDVSFSLSQNKEEADIIISTSLEKSLTSFKENIYLAASKNFELKENEESYFSFPFASFTSAKEFRTICDEECLNNKIEYDVSFECDNVYSVKRLILSGNSIGFWPEYTWGSTNEFKLIELKKYSFYRYINVTKASIHMHNQNIVDLFYDYLIKCFKQKQIIALI